MREIADEQVFAESKSPYKQILPQHRRFITSPDFTVFLSFSTNDSKDLEFSPGFERVVEILNEIRRTNIYQLTIHFSQNK